MSSTVITGMKLILTNDSMTLFPPLVGCRVVSYSHSKWGDMEIKLLWNPIATGSSPALGKIMNALKSGTLTILDGTVYPPFHTEVALELRLGQDCLQDNRIPIDTKWAGFSSMKTAPTDGTLIQLKVIDGEHPLADDPGPYLTVGFNHKDDTGENFWHVMGWCWSHDCITQNTRMKILGWKALNP